MSDQTAGKDPSAVTTTAQEPTKTSTGKAKKALIAGAVLAALGTAAFLLGKSRGTTQAVSVHAESHGEPGDHARREGTGVDREREPEAPTRQPASVTPGKKDEPSKEDEDQDYEREDAEEVEVQIAHSAKHGAVVGEAQAAERDVGHDAASGEAVIAHQSNAEHHESEREEHRGFFGRLFGAYADAWQSVQDKVHELQRAEEENRSLRLEKAHLRVMVESQKYGCRVDESKKHAQKVGAKLNAETGTKVARTLASVSYQMPENLLPEQLHALGVGYFKSKDYEKAAVIFTFLTEMEGDASYRTADNFLMTGVAWYHLENYKLSDTYFDRVLQELPSKENAQARVQAKVWHALAANRQKNFGQAQKWLKETLENHPQTQEARWIDPQEGDRQPASHDRGHGKAEAKAVEKKSGGEAHHDEHETKPAHH